MAIDSIVVEKAIQNTKALIVAESDLLTGLKSVLDVLLMLDCRLTIPGES